jgi:nicotinic acid mononucleotide adenylyltransferase
VEKDLIPPYYSYATLHALKTKYCNDEIFVLCGEDTMKSIPDWMHGGKIIEDYDFLVVDRPATAISSTQVREILRTRNKMDAYYSDEKLAYYVSPNVINLLKKYY